MINNSYQNMASNMLQMQRPGQSNYLPMPGQAWGTSAGYGNGTDNAAGFQQAWQQIQPKPTAPAPVAPVAHPAATPATPANPGVAPATPATPAAPHPVASGLSAVTPPSAPGHQVPMGEPMTAGSGVSAISQLGGPRGPQPAAATPGGAMGAAPPVTPMSQLATAAGMFTPAAPGSGISGGPDDGYGNGAYAANPTGAAIAAPANQGLYANPYTSEPSRPLSQNARRVGTGAYANPFAGYSVKSQLGA